MHLLLRREWGANHIDHAFTGLGNF